MIIRDKLIVQSVDNNFLPWLTISRRIHEEYAAACNADYLAFVGWKDPLDVHPSWNRVKMILDGFDAGYEKVVWLDADSIVVDQTVDIFAETDDEVALQMTRVVGSAADFHRQRDLWNSGVLIANRCSDARSALLDVWGHRRAVPLAHHTAELWELNWLLDYIDAWPDIVKDLDLRFNWMPDYKGHGPESEAVIRSFHGIPQAERFQLFKAEVRRVYGP